MLRGPEFISTENAERFARFRDLQDQGDLKARALEIGNPNLMNSAGELCLGRPLDRRMLAIIVDQQLIVDVEFCSVI
jgi:hypothetical protein